MTAPNQEYRLIPLTQGQFAKVSPHRFEELSKRKWSAYWDPTTRSFYAHRWIGKSETPNGFLVSMHREILGLKRGDPREGDHRNHDTLDNTDGNLRISDQAGQARNQRVRKDNKSGYKGVRFYKNINKWGVGIRVNGKRIFIGVFPLGAEVEAAKAYDEAALRYFGEFAHLNFPLDPNLGSDATRCGIKSHRRRASPKSMHS